MYPRAIKVRSSNGTVNEYVRIVEAYREDGKVKQRVVADLGRKDVLLAILPKLQRLLRGDIELDENTPAELKVVDASTWGPVLAIRTLFEQLGLWEILDRCLGRAKGVPFADRAFVLVANRLIRPASEHGLAGWLETDFVCDRMGRRFVPNWHQRNRVRVHPSQLDAWYRTLDQLHKAKERIEECSTTAFATFLVLSQTWCFTTSPAHTLRGPAPTTSPSTVTAATVSHTMFKSWLGW